MVRNAAATLDYVPSTKARALASGTRSLLAAVAPASLPDSAVRAVAEQAVMFEGDVSIRAVADRRQLDGEIDRLAADDRVAAVILMAALPRKWHVARFRKLRVPLITAGAAPSTSSFVAHDDRKFGRLAVEYLAGRGHTSLAFVAGTPRPPPYVDPTTDRLVGYSEVLRELRLPRSKVVRRVNDVVSAAEALRRLAGRSDPPTAIVAATDAVGTDLAMAGARFLGMALVTFEESTVPSRLGLTSVGGESPWPHAVDMICQALRNRSLTSAVVQVRIEPSLFRRDSG